MQIEADKLKASMFDAVENTFAQMAFLDVTNCPEDEIEPCGENWYWSRVAVKRPFIGEMTLKCPKELAEEITGLMYGMDMELTDAMVFDAMAEFANTIIGRCMNLVLPTDKGFELYVPETGIGAPEDQEGTITCHCMVDDRVQMKACFSLLQAGA